MPMTEYPPLRDLVEAMLCTVDDYGPDADTLTIHFEALRAALAARPQPGAEQVTAWLTEHRWRGRVMAVGGGYTWDIGDVLAAAAAVAGSATPTEPERCDSRCEHRGKWGATGVMPPGHHWHITENGGYIAHDVAGSVTPTPEENDGGR